MPKIVLIGEAWGEQEDLFKHPFVGPSGHALLRMMNDASLLIFTQDDWDNINSYWQSDRNSSFIKAIWTNHPEFYPTNVFNFRPQSNDIETLCGTKKETGSLLPSLRAGKYLKPEYLPELDRLAHELSELKPNITILLGGTASWAVLQNSSITKIRGTVAEARLVSGLKVLPTFHPAAVLREWSNRHITVLDLAKAAKQKDFPEIRRPERTVYVEPTLVDLFQFFPRLQEAHRIAIDIETAGNQITCIGFSPDIHTAIVVPFVDLRKPSASYWPSLNDEISAWKWVRSVCELPNTKVFQNGIYDMHFLYRGYGIKVENAAHDTMLLHHALQPESPKGLGYLGSVYTEEASWKLMRERGKTTLKRED